MIRTGFDLRPVRDRLQAHGRVQLPDYLEAAAADALRDCLEHAVPWTLAVRDGQGARTVPAEAYARMDAAARAELLRDIADGARDGSFRFAYETYMMVTAYKEGRDPGLLLHRVLEFLNLPEVLAFYRALTGEPALRRATAQATCYRPGHFLRQHTDENPKEGRRFAYVINLSRDWQPDWGGLLQFVDPSGSVLDTFMPRWNSLSLFRVPADHIVTPVAPWAAQARYAITGWWTD